MEMKDILAHCLLDLICMALFELLLMALGLR